MAKAKNNGNNFNIPAGYKQTSASGEFATPVDWEKQTLVEGTVVDVKTVQVGKGSKQKDTRVMEVEEKNGNRLAIWEKHQLTDLFNSVKAGKSKVYIQYLGLKKLGGKKTMHEFAAAYK